ncbi:hypothetical protein VE04_03328 [Pseudogymnoascus sp. 24MN13]|nr:hypothetical protein VE04_03328 [Pseudogymnoascus sp. 24MN13]
MLRFLHRKRRPANPEDSEPAFPPRRALKPGNGSETDQPSHVRYQEYQRDPLGLTVLFKPDRISPSVDIVFVHGLRGRSMRTWSLDDDLKLFWPQKWLPDEPAIQTARISKFGYDSDYLAGGPKKTSNVVDFAKDLLSALKFTMDGKEDDIDFGKAYILGTNDDSYEDIINSTSAILFLSTPHRGSDLAELLDRVLKLLVPGRSTKFRHLAPRLEIVSFYETVATEFGPREKMILDKDSSVLGYRGELAIPLYTNHRGVSKFSSRNDPSYIKIRDVLRGMVARFSTWSPRPRNLQAHQMKYLVRALLTISQAPDEDHEFFYDRKTPGTCEWILSERTFTAWLNDWSPKPRIIWFHGAPGTGKSVLASFSVEHIKKDYGSPCEFFYFRYDDQEKTSVSSFLRSMAYQAACNIPEFERRLATMGEAGRLLEKADASLL